MISPPPRGFLSTTRLFPTFERNSPPRRDSDHPPPSSKRFTTPSFSKVSFLRVSNFFPFFCGTRLRNRRNAPRGFRFVRRDVRYLRTYSTVMHPRVYLSVHKLSRVWSIAKNRCINKQTVGEKGGEKYVEMALVENGRIVEYVPPFVKLTAMFHASLRINK